MGLRVEEAGGKWYVTGTLMKERVRRSTTLDATPEMRPEAEKVRLFIEQQILNGTYNKARPPVKSGRNIFTAVDDYMKMHINSMKGGYNVLKQFAKDMASVKLEDLTSQDVQDWVKKRFSDPATGGWRVKASTLQTETAHIKRVLRMEYERGWLARPIKLSLPSRGGGRDRYMTPAQVGDVLANANAYVRPIFTFLLYTGARLREAVRLDWKDVDLQKAEVLLTTSKGNDRALKFRRVPLPGRVITELSALPNRDGRVFRNAYGLPYEPKSAAASLHYHWKALRTKLGIGDITIHDFRHTFASGLAASDVDIRQIADLLGHQNLERTRRYAHLSPSKLRDAIKKLPFFGAYS